MKYVIVELIPTSRNPQEGDIIQLSAIKIDNFVLKDRLDIRLEKEKVTLKKLLELIDYDENLFEYVSSTEEIITKFVDFVGDYPLVIIDNEYTENYLTRIKNPFFYLHNLIDLKSSDFIIEEMIEKYNLEMSNYIVDLIFEALIYESDSNLVLIKNI